MAGAGHTWVDGDAPNTTWLNALPRGVMAFATVSAAQSGISAEVDVTGLSVTFTAESSRLYLTVVNLHVQQLTSTGGIVLRIADGAGTQVQACSENAPANDSRAFHLEHHETGLSGSITRKARISTSAGTCTIQGSANTHPIIRVIDLGPA